MNLHNPIQSDSHKLPIDSFLIMVTKRPLTQVTQEILIILVIFVTEIISSNMSAPLQLVCSTKMSSETY